MAWDPREGGFRSPYFQLKAVERCWRPLQAAAGRCRPLQAAAGRCRPLFWLRTLQRRVVIIDVNRRPAGRGGSEGLRPQQQKNPMEFRFRSNFDPISIQFRSRMELFCVFLFFFNCFLGFIWMFLSRKIFQKFGFFWSYLVVLFDVFWIFGNLGSFLESFFGRHFENSVFFDFELFEFLGFWVPWAPMDGLPWMGSHGWPPLGYWTPLVTGPSWLLDPPCLLDPWLLIGSLGLPWVGSRFFTVAWDPWEGGFRKSYFPLKAVGGRWRSLKPVQARYARASAPLGLTAWRWCAPLGVVLKGKPKDFNMFFKWPPSDPDIFDFSKIFSDCS